MPGVNGDEAWYGVQALQLLEGRGVQWRTPTGNVVPPFQIGSLVVLHALAAPSFTLLRLPAVVSGILQVLLVWVVFRRFFDRRTGALAAAVTAALPANVAYSRFGWDVSHSGLLVALALYCALSTKIVGTALLFSLCVWAHPTNVFVAPFLLLAFGGAELRRSTPRASFAHTGALAAAMATAGALTISLTAGGGAAAELGVVIERVASGSQWWRFAVLLERFLLGDVTFEYIVGRPMGPLPTAWDIVVLAGLAGLVLAAAARLYRGRAWMRLGILVGALVTCAFFAVVVGPDGITPHTERYGYALLVPLVTAFAIACGAVADRAGRLLPIAALLIGAGFAWRFHHDYLDALRRTGSLSHPTFWTGDPEPKRAAAELVERETGRARAIVVAEDWWTFWPLRYLLFDVPRIAVTLDDPATPRPSSRPAYFVGFPGGTFDRDLSSADASCLPRRRPLSGYGRKEALIVWELLPCGASLTSGSGLPRTRAAASRG